MVTVTGKSASRRDLSRAALRCVGVSAVFMSLVAAMATGVAVAYPTPAPPPPPPTSTGDGPLHDNSGDNDGGDVNLPPGDDEDDGDDDDGDADDGDADDGDEDDGDADDGDADDGDDTGEDDGHPDGWSDENDNGINDADENPPDDGEDSPPEPEAPRVAAPPGGGGTSPVSPMHRRPRSSVSAQTTVIRRDSTPPPAVELPPIVQAAPVRISAPRVVEQSAPIEPQRLDLPVVPQALRSFSVDLSQSTISPGGRVMATGLGCGPAAPVSLTVGQSPVGATLTDQQGTFAVALATGSLGIGHHDVTADCGETKNIALDVVLVSRVGTGAAATTLILIFMVSGVWYFGHRILSPTDLRNRNV